MEKINQVIDMVEHPERYSEAQVDDILQDEECRQTYLTMMEMRMAFDKKDMEENLDIDQEWQHVKKRQHFAWFKIAASLVGVMLLSGIAIAAVHSYRASHLSANHDVADTMVVASHHTTVAPVSQSEEEKTALPKQVIHKTFDNVPLATMLAEMAKYYGVSVEYRNADAKQLRFYYEWNSEDALSKVVEELNHSQQMNLSLEDDKLIIE